ncbi:VWA domain-containing protein [Actinoplanes sp. NPDC049802]|uniref:caspase, EACC1-associated type n=1 Tax=Actinoplanes sp. NPDC049802 TaxID=3154742 RepID=UPI0033F58F68
MRLPDFERSRAVLIGTARYDRDSLPDLPAVANNVAALRKRLTDPALSGFRGAQCVSKVNPRFPGQVLDPVREAAGQAEDLLFVYFAGHGLLDRGSELYLGVRGSHEERAETSVRFAQFADAILDSPATSKIVVLDCCYSGRAMRHLHMADDRLVARATAQLNIDGLYVLTSSSATKMSLAPEGDEFTAFTGRLLEFIDTGVPGPQELLTMQTLYAAVRDEMQRRRLPRPQQQGGNFAGEAALVRNRAYVRPADGVPLDGFEEAGEDDAGGEQLPGPRGIPLVWRRSVGGGLCLAVLAATASAAAGPQALARCAAPTAIRMLVPLDTVEMFTDITDSYEYATRGAGDCQRIRVSVSGASRDDVARAFALSWRTPPGASARDRRLLHRIGLPPDVWVADLGPDMAAVQSTLAGTPGARVRIPDGPEQWSLAESPVVLAEQGEPGGIPLADRAAPWAEHVTGTVRPDPDTTTVGRLVNAFLFPPGQQAAVARAEVQLPLDAAAAAAGQGAGPPDVTALLCRPRGVRVIVAEWQLVRHNLHRGDGGRCGGVWNTWYPADTGWLDFPMTQPVWAHPQSDRVRRAAGRLTAWLRSAAGGRVLADNGLRPRGAVLEAGLISANGALRAWHARQAYATSAANLERAEQAYAAARIPATVLVAVDGSGSMTASRGGRTRFGAALDGITAAVGTMGRHDRFGLFIFSTALDGGIAEVTGDARTATERARGYRPAGGTPLHLAVDHGVRKLRDGGGAGGRHRILVVLTDGEDTTGHPLPELGDDPVRVVIVNVGVPGCPDAELSALTKTHGDCIGVPSDLVDVRVAEQIGRLWQKEAT